MYAHVPVPHPPLYHFHVAPELIVPWTDKVIDEPLHIVLLYILLLIPVGPQIVLGFTVIILLTHAVVLHVPSALAKYVVEEFGVTIIEFPDPTKVPPHAVEYHFHKAPVPSDPPFIFNVTEVPALIVVAVADILDAAILIVFIVKCNTCV